jgi:hypothetical protein
MGWKQGLHSLTVGSSNASCRDETRTVRGGKPALSSFFYRCHRPATMTTWRRMDVVILCALFCLMLATLYVEGLERMRCFLFVRNYTCSSIWKDLKCESSAVFRWIWEKHVYISFVSKPPLCLVSTALKSRDYILLSFFRNLLEYMALW